MMTLDEAITHAEWCADNSCGECADDHRQLAEWLKELAQWKKLVEEIDLRPASLMKPFQPNDLERENDSLKAENAELRYKVHVLEGGNKGLQILNDSVKANNAKLRELLHNAAIELYVNGNVTDGATELLFDQMRELGIEVVE